jgi:hypothetical protein
MNESIKILVLFFWVVCSAYFQEQAEQNVKNHPVLHHPPIPAEQITLPPDSVSTINSTHLP